MQAKTEMSSQQAETLATATIRRNAKSVLRTLLREHIERLAAVEQQRFEAQCEFRRKCIECENAVEHIFDQLNNKI